MSYKIIILPASAVLAVYIVVFLFVAVINHGVGAAVLAISDFIDAHQGVFSALCCTMTALCGGFIAGDEVHSADDFKKNFYKENVISFISGALIWLPIGIFLALMTGEVIELMGKTMSSGNGISGLVESLMMTGLLLLALFIMGVLLLIVFFLLGYLPCKLLEHCRNSVLLTILIPICVYAAYALLIFLINR